MCKLLKSRCYVFILLCIPTHKYHAYLTVNTQLLERLAQRINVPLLHWIEQN